MPLTSSDRRFLKTVERLKLCVFFMALAVFLYLLAMPAGELQMATAIVGIALCAMFWLTQRLLSLVVHLDFELTRLSKSVERSFGHLKG